MEGGFFILILPFVLLFPGLAGWRVLRGWQGSPWRSASQPAGAQSPTLTPCPECQYLIPEHATRCPRCGLSLNFFRPGPLVWRLLTLFWVPALVTLLVPLLVFFLITALVF